MTRVRVGKIKKKGIVINFTSDEVYGSLLKQLGDSEIQVNKNNDDHDPIIILRPNIAEWKFEPLSSNVLNSLSKETIELHQKIGSALRGISDSTEMTNENDYEEYTVTSIWDFWKIFGQEREKFVIDETPRIQKVIFDIYRDNSILYQITPFEFEKMIAELLAFQGFKVELTKQTKDGGYDIIALRYIDNHNPLKFLVECKRFAEKRGVNVEIIRSFKEVIQSENANRGIIVTTSYFTTNAVKKQNEVPYLLDFKDKNDIIRWIGDYKLK